MKQKQPSQFKFKNDTYRTARGGWSRLLDITCEKCEQHICFYQKDGPGPLKRMYVDRIIDPIATLEAKFLCGHCQAELGMKITYAKEDRLAYRLFQDSVKKRIVSSR